MCVFFVFVCVCVCGGGGWEGGGGGGGGVVPYNACTEEHCSPATSDQCLIRHLVQFQLVCQGVLCMLHLQWLVAVSIVSCSLC